MKTGATTNEERTRMGLGELKAELSKRGLSTDGRKRELARRLEDAVTGGPMEVH